MRKLLFFTLLGVLSFIIASCNGDGKDTLASKFTTATSSPGVVSTTVTNTTTTSTQTAQKYADVYGIVTDNYGIPINGVMIEMTSVNNSSLIYQAQTKSETKEVTFGTSGSILTYNFMVSSMVSDVYTVKMNKAGYMEKDFLLQIQNENTFFTAEVYNNLSTNLGVISAHYNGNNDLPSAAANVKEIVLSNYLTQDGLEVSSTPTMQIILPPKGYVAGNFKFENLPETVEYIKKVMHPDGSTEEYQMKTHYRIKLSILNNATGLQENVAGDDINVKAGETTLVEIFPASQNSVATIPNLVSPPNTSEVYEETPIFSWESVSGASKYELVVAEDVDNDDSYEPSDPIVWQSIIKNSTSIIYSQINQDTPLVYNSSTLGIYTGNIPALKENTRYFWCVRAEVISWKSPSSVFRFVKRKMTPPQPISPENGSYIASLNPNFSWSMSSGCNQYVLELASTPEVNGSIVKSVFWQFTDVLLNNVIAINKTYTGTVSLTRGCTYYWRVAGSVAHNIPTAWSEWRSFTLLLAPPAPVFVSATYHQASGLVQLQWTTALGADVDAMNDAHVSGFNVDQVDTEIKPDWIMYWDTTTAPPYSYSTTVTTTEAHTFQVTTWSTAVVESGSRSISTGDMTQAP
ncbi:MAG: hypothetical protein PHW04_03185 [Candidatus Wallbacteria bacterium]|nr:hypothetical protein [Candidatus Wallbacteria bacterium]